MRKTSILALIYSGVEFEKQVEFRHLETMEMGIPAGDGCGNKGSKQEWYPVCERSI